MLSWWTKRTPPGRQASNFTLVPKGLICLPTHYFNYEIEVWSLPWGWRRSQTNNFYWLTLEILENYYDIYNPKSKLDPYFFDRKAQSFILKFFHEKRSIFYEP